MMAAVENAERSPMPIERLPKALVIHGGLVPFLHERYSVVAEEEAPPFLRLQAEGADLAFHVVDPFLVIEDYAPELGDEDAAVLGLTRPEDAMLLAIVNLNRGAAQATANLAAPIAVNVRTGRAKQAILRNAAQFGVRHRLLPD